MQLPVALERTILTSAARTASGASSAQLNTGGHRGVLIVVDVTAVSGTTPTLTPAVQGLDPVSGKWVDLHSDAAAISTTGTYTYVLYPGVSETVGTGGLTKASSGVLPRQWRFQYAIGGTSPSFTFSVGAVLIP